MENCGTRSLLCGSHRKSLAFVGKLLEQEAEEAASLKILRYIMVLESGSIIGVSTRGVNLYPGYYQL